MKNSFASILTAVAVGFTLSAAEISNPGFTLNPKGELTSWTNANKSPVKSENGVLSVTAAKGQWFDSIYQRIKITPSSDQYIFSADINAPVAGAAFVQVKMYSKGKEVIRRQSLSAPAGKSRMTTSAVHPAADVVEVAIRINPAAAGKVFEFSKPVLFTPKDGEICGGWVKGASGKVSDVSDNQFTITIDKASKSHASMGHLRDVVSGKKYVFEADFKSDLSNMAYLEAKYYKNNKEIKRKQAYSKGLGNEGKLVLEINTDGCDRLLLQCRIPGSDRFVGKKVVFSNFKFKEVK